MHRGQRPAAGLERDPATALAGQAESAAEHDLRGDRAQAHDVARAHALQLALQPLQAGRHFRRVCALVQAALAAQLELEVLDHVGHVHRAPIDADLGQHLVEQMAGRADERAPLTILAIAGLLADEEQFRVGGAFAEHGLRRLAP